jgi:hypothetical protein
MKRLRRIEDMKGEIDDGQLVKPEIGKIGTVNE